MTECRGCVSFGSSMCTRNNKPTEDSQTCEKFIDPTQMTLFHLKTIVSDWLWISDSEVIDIVVAAAFANDLLGDPIWLFMVAPPGGMKTEILRALSDYGPVVSVSSLTAHTLISGLTHKPDFDLLPKLDGKIMVIKDFTTIISQEKERMEIFAQLRDCYDGYYEKSFGSIGKKGYHSKFGLLAGVTQAVDMYRSISSLLGERFLKVRGVSDREKVIEKARRIAGQEVKMRSTLRRAFSFFLTYKKADGELDIPDDISNKIQFLAMFVSWMRSDVTRDHFHKVISVPDPEIGTRLVKQLKKLMISLAICRGRKAVEEKDYATIMRVGKDCIDPKRWAIFNALIKLAPISGEERPKTVEVAKSVHIPTTTCKEMLEDTWSLGLIERHGGGDEEGTTYRWEIKPDVLELAKKCGIVKEPPS